MTINNRNDYIQYRFQRAEESFEEALILAEKERWNYRQKGDNGDLYDYDEDVKAFIKAIGKHI